MSEETNRKLKEENDQHHWKQAISDETIRKLNKANDAYVQKEAMSEETNRKLKEENDQHVWKQATLEETINNLQAENELQTQRKTDLERRIAQLLSENSSLLKKEASLVETNNQLLDEKAVLSPKGESLERKINLLESDLNSLNEKENSTKDIISNLNEDISLLKGQVAELEESRNNLLLENQQLRENVSGLQSTIQNLENIRDSFSRDASAKDCASENEDLKSQIESAVVLVEKLMTENAELVEKVNELFIELEQKRWHAEVGFSGVTGSDGMTGFAKQAAVVTAVPESAEIMSLEEASMKDFTDAERLVPNSSLVSDDAGEIVQIPLDDNETVRDQELQDVANDVGNGDVPLADAPLIGAPFRLVSFVAKYVSGADLVNQTSSNSGR
ncbi:hypothetical protein Lalb_Chr01g0023901 [Lupinus albus]|uniref:Uncharacterized protein n=1 Tax=Lupinus albus TaxID=3870 RepID=A0A6A4RBC7_LUPAL|nr:hypothetical protein Lalb_Chr01g0023901 [Lupinus albus]